jgi:four helix bundle protein
MNLRVYGLAKNFYFDILSLKISKHLKDQLLSAASSIALNISEGAGRVGRGDKRRFFNIAYASGKECFAILELSRIEDPKLLDQLDHILASLFKLIQKT